MYSVVPSVEDLSTSTRDNNSPTHGYRTGYQGVSFNVSTFPKLIVNQAYLNVVLKPAVSLNIMHRIKITYVIDQVADGLVDSQVSISTPPVRSEPGGERCGGNFQLLSHPREVSNSRA